MFFFLRSICRWSRNGWVGPAWVGRRDLASISASSSKSFDLLVLLRHNHVFTSKRSGGKSGLENFLILFKIVIALSWFRRDWSEKKQPNWISRLRKAEKFRWVFDFLTIFKHLYCKTIKRQKIQPGKKISSFPTFCAGKTYHGARIFGQGPPSLILGIVHFLLMRWSSSYSWSSSSLVAIEQIVSDCSRSSRSSPYSWSSRAWSQSSKLFLIACGGNSSLGSAFSMGLETLQLFSFNPSTHCTIVIVTGADS